MTSKIIRSKLSDVSIPTDISLSEFILNKIAAYGDDVALVRHKSLNSYINVGTLNVIQVVSLSTNTRKTLDFT